MICDLSGIMSAVWKIGGKIGKYAERYLLFVHSVNARHRHTGENEMQHLEFAKRKD